jgi:hypothetical protein
MADAQRLKDIQSYQRWLVRAYGFEGEIIAPPERVEQAMSELLDDLMSFKQNPNG